MAGSYLDFANFACVHLHARARVCVCVWWVWDCSCYSSMQIYLLYWCVNIALSPHIQRTPSHCLNFPTVLIFHQIKSVLLLEFCHFENELNTLNMWISWYVSYISVYLLYFYKRYNLLKTNSFTKFVIY
jgi:hypothetical protein